MFCIYSMRTVIRNLIVSYIKCFCLRFCQYEVVHRQFIQAITLSGSTIYTTSSKHFILFSCFQCNVRNIAILSIGQCI